jgi:microcystin-dependent protein
MPFIGTIRATGFNFIEQGWLPCNGQYVDQNMYQALFAVIGNSYGPPQPGKFALPNLGGRVAGCIGPSNPLGSAEGQETVALSVAQMPPHTHTVSRRSAPTLQKTNAVNATTNLGSIAHVAGTAVTVVPSSDNEAPPNPPLVLDATFAQSMLSPTGAGQPHENRQPYLPMLFSICTDGDFPARPT